MSINISLSRSPRFFKVLAHDVRWKILSVLTRSDYRGQELVQLLKQPQNSVSYHIQLLRSLDLVEERRSAADERCIYYSLNFERFQTLYFSSADALHPALSASATQPQMKKELSHSQKPARVLFLCTHNSARSQMAEGILRSLSQGRIEAYSAGSQPRPVHPSAVKALAALGMDISQQRSKQLDEVKEQTFDYIVTVCDRVREACPTFPSDPERIHWSIADPVAQQGSEEEQYHAFERVALELMTRIRYLIILIDRERGAARTIQREQ